MRIEFEIIIEIILMGCGEVKIRLKCYGAV